MRLRINACKKKESISSSFLFESGEKGMLGKMKINTWKDIRQIKKEIVKYWLINIKMMKSSITNVPYMKIGLRELINFTSFRICFLSKNPSQLF